MHVIPRDKIPSHSLLKIAVTDSLKLDGSFFRFVCLC